MEKQVVHLVVNGETHDLLIYPNRLLLDALRQDLGLTGTKEGCDDGSCGACTILVDGSPMQCCMMLAASYQNVLLTTIEGLADRGVLAPLQAAFCSEGGQQCGFCTPGLILTAQALLDEIPRPTVKQIQDAIAGNLCRCTGYTKIIRSVQKAAGIEQMEAEATAAALPTLQS